MRTESLRDQQFFVGDGKHDRPFLIGFDYCLLGVLVLLAFAAFQRARLPMLVDFTGIAEAYWLGTAANSTFAAILLAVCCLPLEQTLAPMLRRFGQSKGLLFLICLVVAGIFWAMPWRLAVIVAVDALGVAELTARLDNRMRLAAVLIPALYLFSGLILVFALNHAIAGIEDPGKYDYFLNRIDGLLFGVDVSQLAHWTALHLPKWTASALESVYFSLFSALGGTLLLVALLHDACYAVKYVRTIMICYALALAVYFVLPAKGPYNSAPLPARSFGLESRTIETQEALAARAEQLWRRQLKPDVIQVNPEDYFISFPSLHVALPIIAFWFLRPWKRMARIFLFYFAALLLPSILLLEWHYLIDFAGGFLTAALAIALSERVSEPGESRVKSIPAPLPAQIARALYPSEQSVP